MRVALYRRVSTTAQAEEGESLGVQLERLRALAAYRGWEVAGEYVDAGISGSTAEDRPDFMRMMADAKARAFDVVAVLNLSRFGRNVREVLNHAETLKDAGVFLVTEDGSIDTSKAMGSFFLAILGAVAELEREQIRERMAGGRDARWKRKDIFVGQLGYGYAWDKEARRVVQVPEEAKAVRDAVAWYLAGDGFRTVAERLNAAGVPTKRRGKGGRAPKWVRSTVSVMLSNPALYGRVTAKDGAIEYAVDEPVLTRQQWERVQQRRGENKVKAKRHSHPERWARDVLECARCGGKLRPARGFKRPDGTRAATAYVCGWDSLSARARAEAGREKCNLGHLPAEALEARVWHDVCAPLWHLENLERRAGAALGPDRYDQRLAALAAREDDLKAQLDKAEAARARLFTLFEGGDVARAELAERLRLNADAADALRARLGEAAGERDALTQQRDNDRALQDWLGHRKGYLERLRAGLRRLGPADRKRLVESLVDGRVAVDAEERGAGEDDETARVVTLRFKRRWDLGILETLLAEGKLAGGSGGSGPSDGGSLGNDDRTFLYLIRPVLAA